MISTTMMFDQWEAGDEVRERRPSAARMAKPAYSPRYAARKTRGPLSQHGAHRRRQKRYAL